MGAGDVLFGNANVDDTTAIEAILSGSAVVADDVTSWVHNNKVYFAIVKAA